eukprot:10604568-Karenia_brevis.AAC.1
MSEDLFGREEPENKRRRTQEEEDWQDDFWKSEDVVSRDIGLGERDMKLKRKCIGGFRKLRR